MNYVVPRYDPWVVTASVSIAFLASYVALDLAERIRANATVAARTWWAGGSVAMGTGIWSMHFVGMLAVNLPFALGYTLGLTFLSWLAAVVVSGIALGIASGGKASVFRVGAGALAMGVGICAMHYTGMAALDMAPGIDWNPLLVAASAAIAVGASAAALVIFFTLHRLKGRRRLHFKLLAAVVMGLAISGMHYTGMGAANFIAGSVCLSANQLGGNHMGGLVLLASGTLLLLTLVTATLDARMQHRTARLAASLQEANSQLQSANDELKQRAFLDPLTGLPNRLLFEDRLAHALSRNERDSLREASSLAVLFVDLDGFKPVNDSLGHAAGDQVLIELSARMIAAARDSDTIARVGGDEFVLLLENLRDPSDASVLADRLVKATAQPFEYEGRSVQVTASIGIALYPEHGQRHDLMTNADAAMYAAKRTGGNTYAVFESHMTNGASQQFNLQSDLRHAVTTGTQLSLHYQPKLDGRRSLIRGVEALLRWMHPEHGMISPAVFIPIAERFGLINQLGNWVIEETCRQMRAWDDEGLRLRVAINLSVHQLRQDDLVDRIKGALDHYGIEPERLLCEITESVAMKDIAVTQHTFDALRRVGVFLSIDDFGTGYSSLSYLRQLPAEQLKIDRSFVKDIEDSSDARAVVDAVIKLAHALDLEVVAEGVETAGQRDILLSLNCDELQGFLFARPMTSVQLSEWALGHRPEGMPEFAPSAYLEDTPT